MEASAVLKHKVMLVNASLLKLSSYPKSLLIPLTVALNSSFSYVVFGIYPPCFTQIYEKFAILPEISMILKPKLG